MAKDKDNAEPKLVKEIIVDPPQATPDPKEPKNIQKKDPDQDGGEEGIKGEPEEAVAKEKSLDAPKRRRKARKRQRSPRKGSRSSSRKRKPQK